MGKLATTIIVCLCITTYSGLAFERGNDINLDEADIKRSSHSLDITKYIKEHFRQQQVKQGSGGKGYYKKIQHGKKEIEEEEEEEEGLETMKRDARRDRVYLWQDRIVPYEFSPELKSSATLIESALSEIQSKTCLHFVPKTAEHSNWLLFVDKTGCWSSVGKDFWRTGYQEISLGPNCLYKGIIMHEVMHALGFYHEQSRSDRDQFIEIFWENIPEGKMHNFEKHGQAVTDFLKAPYDYQSIMHYGKYSFAKNSEKPTILSIMDKKTNLGQRNHLSPTDIFQINELYDCKYGGHGWSRWSSYGPCDKNCRKERARFCRDRKKDGTVSCENPKSSAMYSWGVDVEQNKCSQAECYAPKDGHWNKWGTWGACSVTCGQGVHSRTRICDDPKPLYGGKKCQGSNMRTRKCLERKCGAGMYDCTFDVTNNPFCLWKHDESAEFRFQRNSGTTPSAGTGPKGDHTSGTGYYAFIESSSPARKGWKARLVSPMIAGGRKNCMKFYYSMNGHTTGILRVFAQDMKTKIKTILFEEKGHQLDQWQKAEFDIHPKAPSKIIIEAERGPGFQGDIAIDDIDLKKTDCSGSITTPKPKQKIVKRVGCYNDFGYLNGKRPFTKTKSFRKEIQWSIYMKSLQEMAMKCAAFAREHKHRYFAVQYWGECWTGPDEEINYGRDGESTGCFPPVTDNRGPYIVGMEFANMVYRWE